VHKGVDEPECPTVDTSMFIPYATNVYTPGKGTYSNIRIPPNTNPSFNAGTVLKGVIYIEQPNSVTFNGNASIQGVIVTDTDKPAGNLTTNSIKFTGSFSAQGVESLDPSYGNLRNLSGSFMLMPNFAVTFTGNFDATAHGNIVVDQASMTGSSSVKLDGSLVILKDTPMTMGGNSQLTAGDNALGFPAGLKFSNRYVALPDTYDEVKIAQ
jgi:type 1 fimbria pilin